MAKILVTGINGFVGRHLAQELHAQGHEVVGVGYDAQANSLLQGFISTYHACDLTKPEAVAGLPLTEIEVVISLAGLAKVGDSFSEADTYNHVNVAVLSVLGERLLALQASPRVLAISTGAVYSSDQSMPLTEDSRLITDGSPYALSKIAMEKAAVQLHEHGLDCVIVRPFNHIGPGQKDGFLVPDLYAKIKQASQANDTLKVGDLTTRRDYTDVRDVVKAYTQLAAAPRLDYGVYNVCTGKSIDGQTILDNLLTEMAQTNLNIEQDPGLLRPNDPRDLFGSNERLKTQTTWQPTIPLQQTLHDFVTAADTV